MDPYFTHISDFLNTSYFQSVFEEWNNKVYTMYDYISKLAFFFNLKKKYLVNINWHKTLIMQIQWDVDLQNSDNTKIT